MTTNVEKCKKLGILKDLKENYTEAEINNMDPKEVLDAWFQWEGIIGYTNRIVEMVQTLWYEKKDN